MSWNEIEAFKDRVHGELKHRKYIPIGFLSPDIITSNSCLIIPYATLYHFGILTSEMHMAWVKYVCGRLKSDYRYSNTIVYNNFPFPETATDKQKQTVETCAQAVLDTRVKYPDSSLADLYDPLTMPPDLLKAHQKLDKAVDLCYRPQPFTSELNRIEYLFELYEKLRLFLFILPVSLHPTSPSPHPHPQSRQFRRLYKKTPRTIEVMDNTKGCVGHQKSPVRVKYYETSVTSQSSYPLPHPSYRLPGQGNEEKRRRCL